MSGQMIWMARMTLAVGLATVAAGCGVSPEEDPNALEGVQQPVLVGNWKFDLWDGDSGPSPFLVQAVCPDGLCMLPMCAALEAGRWHGGKLWGRTCNFEYGDKVRRKSTYAVLQNPSSGSYGFVANFGQPWPANAIISPNGAHPGIPVCQIRDFFGNGIASGKVWDGMCRAEFGNNVWKEFPFNYIVQE